MNTDPEKPVTKAALRQYASTLPRPTPEDAAQVVDHLYRHLSDRLPATVVTYLALGDECDLTDLVDRLPGWRWLYPRVPDDDPSSLSLHDRGGPLEHHRWGMEQPTDAAPIVDPIHVDVILVPGMLFSTDGTRLGRGTGHYDRLLTRLHKNAERIGVTVDARLQDHIPREPHDIPMTAIVTESGFQPV